MVKNSFYFFGILNIWKIFLYSNIFLKNLIESKNQNYLLPSDNFKMSFLNDKIENLD